MSTAGQFKPAPLEYPLPPGPSYRTILGFMKDFRKGQLDFFDELLVQYGDLVCIKMFPTPMILSVNPEHYEHIFVKRPDKLKILTTTLSLGSSRS